MSYEDKNKDGDLFRSLLYEDKNKNESLFHSALIYSKKIGIGSKSSNEYVREKLLEYGSFEKIYENFNYGILSLEDSLKSIKGIENIANALNRTDFDFSILTVNDSEFPESLRKEGNTPVIYARGDLSLLKEKSMAVVGTRHIYPKKDKKAYDESFNVMTRLIGAGYTIVSGLAEGCDTIGHERAISLKGKTIAVLGTPLNQSYPASNKNLQERIAKEHLLVSQYPIGIKTFESYFAHRNLTTASLATEGIVVIKASDNSGTRHAIDACANQGKTVYVLANNFEKNWKWLEIYKDSIKRVDKK